MRIINYITEDCFESKEVYNKYLKLVKEEQNKNIKIVKQNPLDRILKVQTQALP